MILEGRLDGSELKIAIVVARFNEIITDKLLEGCTGALKRHGVEDITIVHVPGSYEIPLVAKKLAKSGKFDAIVALGAVIRGATSHYDYVCNETAKGVSQVSLNHEIPVIFGVLTTDTLEQAFERSGSKAGNKGYDAGVSAIEMANLMKLI